jgi:hypothetical protein
MDMNTSRLTPIPSDLPVPPPTEEVKAVGSVVGQLVLALAKNFLPEEAAVDFTLKKVIALKNSGVSLSTKLSSSQVHRIVSELGVLGLATQIAEGEKEINREKSEMDARIFDFSSMTDEELSSKEKELEARLTKLESERQLVRSVKELEQVLNSIANKLPAKFINREELTEEFVSKLKQVSNLSPQTIVQLSNELIQNLQGNVESLNALVEKGRQFIFGLAKKQQYQAESEEVEQHIQTFLSQQSSALSGQFYLNDSNFKVVLNGLLAKLHFGEYPQSLLRQMANKVNHQAWNDMLKEIKEEALQLAKNKYALESLSSDEMKVIESEIAETVANLNIPWEISSDEFQKEIIQPMLNDLQVKLNETLQKMQYKRENLARVEQSIEEYGAFLLKKAQETHHVKPSFQLMQFQINETGELFFSELIRLLDVAPDLFKEQLEFLKTGLYDKSFTDEWLKKVASYKKVQNLKENPKEFVEKLWDKEIGSSIKADRQELLNQLVEEASSLIKSRELTEETIKELEERVIALRPEVNRLQLEDLRKRLLEDKEISPDVVEEIMNNWGVIGTDVQLNLTVLDESRKQKIIEIAKNRAQLNTTLENVKKDLESHALIPNPIVIESKYKQLQRLMGSFPEMNATQRYNLIVNKALLQQELVKRRTPVQSLGSVLENRLLKWLGFSPHSSFYSSAAIQKLIEDMLNSEQLSQQNADLIKKEIQEAEFSGRLKAAGMPVNEIENMKKLIRKVEQFEKDLAAKIHQLAEEAVPLEKFDHLPRVKLSLSRSRQRAVRKQIDTVLDGIFKDNESLKKALSQDPEKYEKSLAKIDVDKLGIVNAEMQEIFKKDLRARMEKEIKFFEKWQHRLVVDAIQGLEDPQEVLQEGVCQAKCLRVGHMEQTHPDLPVDQIGAERITPSDRFEQARYSKAFKDLRYQLSDQNLKTEDVIKIVAENRTVPEEVYRKYGYKELQWLAFAEENQHAKKTIVEDIADNMADLPLNFAIKEQLKKSNGVLQIGIHGEDWGHAMHCRVDLERKIFRYHEPNIGVFQIPSTEGDLKAAKELAELWKDIMDTFYSNATSCQLYQLV